MAARMDRAVDRSLPRTCCHFFNETRRWDGQMDASISFICAKRWAGKEMVFSNVCIIQPSTTLDVAHEASPFTIFLVEDGSWRWAESALSKGRSTVSKVCRRARLTLRRVRVPPCTIPKNSST
jgi:hypothetical protein